MGLRYLLDFYRRLQRKKVDRPEVVIIPAGWKIDGRMIPKPVSAEHRRYRYGRLSKREVRKPKGGQ